MVWGAGKFVVKMASVYRVNGACCALLILCSDIIGVNRPAIVQEIPHFGIFPAFPHFVRTSRISGFISK